eukprot:CAMPEP_0170195396 /NCGR_PEP_ID=MMETSP0040_2-20121228/61444_1 /TAXON_ID=641309 /ORGANISM="Lotharella oceanica, Strain CCMP622" /LENGTH=232 /DNA_ID=CAMNT_0010444551 /DNA_START=74 /DNA_END=772 /DNA_ORIENTATION=+
MTGQAAAAVVNKPITGQNYAPVGNYTQQVMLQRVAQPGMHNVNPTPLQMNTASVVPPPPPPQPAVMAPRMYSHTPGVDRKLPEQPMGEVIPQQRPMTIIDASRNYGVNIPSLNSRFTQNMYTPVPWKNGPPPPTTLPPRLSVPSTNKIKFQRNPKLRGKARERKRHICDFCQKEFGQKCTLDAHRRTHTGERPYACTLCPNAFKQLATLRRHQVRLHEHEMNLSEKVKQSYS